MTTISVPQSVHKDMEFIAARLDRDYAICVGQQKPRYNGNAVDFSYLCEELKVLDHHGKPTDDAATWTRFVGYLSDLMLQYGELQARQAEIRAEAGKQIIISVKLFSHEVTEVAAELTKDVSIWVKEFTNSPEYRAAFAFSDSAATAVENFIRAFTGGVQNVIKSMIKNTPDGISKARRFLNGVKHELDLLRKEFTSLKSQAMDAGERIKSRIRAIKLPDDLASPKGSSVKKAEFYAKEVSKIAGEEIKKIPVGGRTVDYIDKLGRAFRWVSIAASINEILQADEKIRQTLMEIAAFGTGVLISGVFATLLLPLGPVLFIPLFVIFAGIASYYGTELAKEVVGAIYDWVVHGTPPPFIEEIKDGVK